MSFFSIAFSLQNCTRLKFLEIMNRAVGETEKDDSLIVKMILIDVH